MILKDCVVKDYTWSDVQKAMKFPKLFIQQLNHINIDKSSSSNILTEVESIIAEHWFNY